MINKARLPVGGPMMGGARGPMMRSPGKIQAPKPMKPISKPIKSAIRRPVPR